MEDPWGYNAWSAGDPDKIADNANELLDPPKWNAFERDPDKNTIDDGVPSWSAASGSGWREGTNLWNAESSTLDVWKPSLNSDETREVPELEPEDTKEQEDSKSPETRVVLPTPPLSPLPLSSAMPPLAENSLKSLPSPDHFGSFESAEVINQGFDDSPSWIPEPPHFPSEATDEPWGAAWCETVDEGEERKRDEWELIQEARQKRDRKVPPELLDSLVKQWNEFATSLNPKSSTEDSEQASWRKGLDSIDGLAELVDSLLPVTSFPPPTPFNKTAVAKSVKETLRLTRFSPLTQSSPMAHLHASKGSTDWEKSVKAQKTVANDEWGWDLKHKPEEQAAADSVRDKKGGGLLSFWSRKASSMPSAVVDSSTANSFISPTILSNTVPTTSTQPSIESSCVASTTTTSSPPLQPPDNVDTVLTDIPQASAVSRFFNRFSRKPSAITTASSGQEKRTSLSLTSGDLSFLSDVTPSTTNGSMQTPPESASTDSLGAMLSGFTKNSSLSVNKLPPPLDPPLIRSSHPPGSQSSNSFRSDTSFDEEMADSRFMNILDMSMGRGPSSSSGYAPVTIDLLESPKETKSMLPVLQFPNSPLQSASTSLSSRNHSPAIFPISPQISQNAPTVASDTAPPIPLPHSLDTPSRQRQSITLARFHDPLPPTPKHGLDDLADFFSSSPHSGENLSPHPPLHSQYDSFPSTKTPTTTSLLSLVSTHSNSVPVSKPGSSVDFGDFGDFISTPTETPSPSEDPLKTVKAAMHKPTFELVKKGAARTGRWPTPSSPVPVPVPLSPPPGPSGPSSGLGYFNISLRQPSQLDLLTSDTSPVRPTSVSGTFSVPDQTAVIKPFFSGTSSRPASTAFGQAPAPLSALSTSRTSSPSLSPNSFSSKPAGGSGLSAQDLSFFEGL